MIQWRKFELKKSYTNEFMNFLIFQDLVNRAGPTEVKWHDANTWRGHASPHGCLRGAYVT